MSATERLRELLDDRGVKWIEWKDPDTTAWLDGSHGVRAEEYDGQLLVERVMTPEQAIAVTLGRGTCHDVNDPMKSGEIAFRCSECDTWDESPRPRFCHGCGRKVADK